MQVIQLRLCQRLAGAGGIASGLRPQLRHCSPRCNSGRRLAGSCPHRGRELPPQYCGANRGAGSSEGHGPRGGQVHGSCERTDARHGQKCANAKGLKEGMKRLRTHHEKELIKRMRRRASPLVGEGPAGKSRGDRETSGIGHDDRLGSLDFGSDQIENNSSGKIRTGLYERSWPSLFEIYTPWGAIGGDSACDSDRLLSIKPWASVASGEAVYFECYRP